MPEIAVGAIPTLTDQEIEERVGAQSFQRGKSYFHNHAIFDARQEGMTLKARSHGSQGRTYRLWASFNSEGITAADCSCPVGDGGYCKHLAALLLTWRERPEEFRESQELERTLEQRSKEELIALVKQMLKQEPELESLLEMPLPVAGKQTPPVDPEVYSRRAAEIFAADGPWGDRWEASRDVEGELAAMVAIGDGFAKQEDWANAAAVYQAIVQESLKHFDEYSGDEGDSLHEIIAECSSGLGTCLEHVRVPAAREPILRSLFEIYRFDVDYGGIGLGEEAPELILELATPEELGRVEDWVRDVMPRSEDWSSDWRRQAYGGFLLDLVSDRDGEGMDDEAFLQLCRETGRTHDLVDRLLDLNRIDEAVQAAVAATDYDLLQLAGVFDSHQRGDLAQQLILERSQTTTDTRIFTWLKDRYRFLGDSAAALELAEKLFRNGPGLAQYLELRELGQKTGRWETVRPQTLKFLHEQRWHDLLIAIYLEEGDVEQALKTLRSLTSPTIGYSYHLYGGVPLAVQVARAAARDHPHEALEIYEKQVERLIAGRNRGSYADAARLLVEMQEIYLDSGEDEAWLTYLEDLRGRYKSLRALKDEMAATGL
jgi:uncharacterized Zn finger protein